MAPKDPVDTNGHDHQATRRCPICRHPNLARALFCNACGAPQSHDPAPAPRRSATAAEKPPGPAEVTQTNPASLLEAERRQLTVMFCDLVASTPLAEALDPESLREVMHAYYTTCRDVVQPLAGHIAQYLGDGLMIYFGYPQAHEDDAQRAVRAALGILSAMRALNDDLQQTYRAQLAIRIGIHTGLVVVGGEAQPGAQTPLALGITPNIAARLQELAKADTVLISAATETLIQGYFVLDDLGLQTLSGLSAPLQVFQVLRESMAQSRLEAASTYGLTAYVGRAPEITLLRQRWASVQAGQGQVVVISGEAGIGKSRLVNLARDDIAVGDYTLFECRTSPYHQHSALHPVVDLLERWLGWDVDAPADEKLNQLEALLSRYRPPLDETVPLFAPLLAIPLPEARYAPRQLPPERQRQQLFKTFVAMILEQAERQPVLFILEDLHWSDPSTLDVLSLLIEHAVGCPKTPFAKFLPSFWPQSTLECQRLLGFGLGQRSKKWARPMGCFGRPKHAVATSLMLLLTSRPEFAPPWAVRSHLTPLALNRLPRSQIERMVDHVAGGLALPAELLDQLVEKTDGVPLFIEEMTKTVLESGNLRQTDGQYRLTEPLTAVNIPTSLQDSLMARLDRLDTVKGVVQIASVIGRRFSYTLLQPIAGLDDAVLQQALRRLVEANLLFQRGVLPHATYTFKHALIQDAAYQSLLKSSRQHYHQRIAEVLQTHFAATVESQPELLAHHFTEAGMTAAAIPHWLSAGRYAIQRSAYVEAVAHLTTGLNLISTLPETPERLDRELALQLRLGSALIAAHGFAAPAVKQTYERARQLCHEIGETPQSLRALSGLQAFYLVSGELQTARELGEQCVELAQRQRDPVRLLQSRYGLGAALLFQGELTRAHTLFEQNRQPSRTQQDHPHTLHDPGVACLTYSALTLWMFGYADGAVERGREALHIAQTLSHPYSITLAQFWLAELHEFRGEWQTAQQLIEANQALAKASALPFWTAMGNVVQGLLQAELGHVESGLDQASRGFDTYRSLGTLIGHTRVYEILATIRQRAHQIEEGQEAIEQALTTMHLTGERWNEVNILRRKGELLLLASPQGRETDQHAQAETCFHQAIKHAQNQRAKSLELRATMSLCRLWQRQGKPSDARQRLISIYEWFTEGFDTADLREAKSLLDDLHT